MRDFTNTKAALAAYDKADGEYRSEWPADADALRMLDELEVLSLAVGRAYCEETSDINSPSCASSVKPGEWLRRTIGVPV